MWIVIAFSEDTPISLIKMIKPDIYIKGGDYTLAALPEVPVVQKLGGEVKFIAYGANRSTSNIIWKITNTYNSFTKL